VILHRKSTSLPARTACAVAALLAALVAAPPAHAAPPADEAKLVVKAPHYGDTLFHFFQSRYFSAVTGLMTSQHFARVAPHDDEAEVLRGGLLLSYGLHHEAGEIFARLIDQTASPAARNRAWYYLAKIRYQRGLAAEAEAALARIDGPLPAPLDEDRALLHAQLLMARGDFTGAAGVLRPLAERQGESRYARFNLGVAMVKSGDVAGGSALLQALGTAPAENEEYRALRDKANVALGFAALQANQPQAARESLERVRLNGAQSAKALLGSGWAASALKQPQQALVPWTELAGRDPSDPAVLEARIAVPFAYAELGAFGQALERYEAAITDYDRESGALNESIAAVRDGRLVKSLAERNPGAEMGWFWNLDTLPPTPDFPHVPHLAGVLAEHEFQEAFKNWRDLQFLERNLKDWADNLVVFNDMLANRQQAFAERLPKVQAGAGNVDLIGAGQRAAAVSDEIARAETARDGLALADARERALQDRIERVQAGLSALGGGPDARDAHERLRLARGALTWQLAREYPARIWQARKDERAIERALGDARDREAALARAQREEPQRLTAFGQRIAALEAQIKALTPRVAALSSEQQAAVQDIAVAALERQKERLAAYAIQARFALAQLRDRASVARKDADAPAR
jgi:hypothetical protein